MDLEKLGRDIVDASYLRGDFVLSSGARSPFYFDKYLFETRPSILRRIASGLARLLPSDTDRIAGPELGAVALAAALSLAVDLPFVIVKREAKSYGTARLVEGDLHRGDRVVVVEDVITTGAQAIHAARQVAFAGANVLTILAVVDREEEGSRRIAEAGYSFQSLFRLSQLGL